MTGMSRTFLIVAVFVCGFYLPWWTLILPTGLVGFLAKRQKRAFIETIAVVFFIWIGMAIYHDLQTEFRLSNRLSLMFSLPSPILIFILTGLIAAFTSALAFALGAQGARITLAVKR